MRGWAHGRGSRERGKGREGGEQRKIERGVTGKDLVAGERWAEVEENWMPCWTHRHFPEQHQVSTNEWSESVCIRTRKTLQPNVLSL